jgi:hypothetical protein
MMLANPAATDGTPSMLREARRNCCTDRSAGLPTTAGALQPPAAERVIIPLHSARPSATHTLPAASSLKEAACGAGDPSRRQRRVTPALSAVALGYAAAEAAALVVADSLGETLPLDDGLTLALGLTDGEVLGEGELLGGLEGVEDAEAPTDGDAVLLGLQLPETLAVRDRLAVMDALTDAVAVDVSEAGDALTLRVGVADGDASGSVRRTW